MPPAFGTAGFCHALAAALAPHGVVAAQLFPHDAPGRAFRRLCEARGLLPTAYCLLPTASYLLLTSYYCLLVDVDADVVHAYVYILLPAHYPPLTTARGALSGATSSVTTGGRRRRSGGRWDSGCSCSRGGH